jgi:hypothetical protein
MPQSPQSPPWPPHSRLILDVEVNPELGELRVWFRQQIGFTKLQELGRATTDLPVNQELMKDMVASKVRLWLRDCLDRVEHSMRDAATSPALGPVDRPTG